MQTLKKDDDLVAEVLDFWFAPRHRKLWFQSTSQFDEQIRQRFEATWELASSHNYDHWQLEPKSALALVIILDQFPLNMYREDTRQYSTESHAREIARAAIKSGFDDLYDDEEKSFLYLPFMHSESLEDQDYSVELYRKAGLKNNLGYAIHHREVVQRFGRFPHRNQHLGRDSSDEEMEYLKKARW